MYGQLFSSKEEEEEEERDDDIDLNLDSGEMQGASDFKEEKGAGTEVFWCAESDGRMSPPGGSRACVDCRTTRTPLWRSGPQGPKSLCNACGIRYRKSRRAGLGCRREEKGKKTGRKRKLEVSWKSMRLWGNEEEQAAGLLMALSCGFVQA